jgi:hypothetical protein
MPPAPIWPVISYGPSRVPGANDTVTRSNYTGMPRREGISNDQRRSVYSLGTLCLKSGTNPALIQRAAVDVDTPHLRAASRTEPPGTAIVDWVFLGLPSCLPCALARWRPSLTRSAMRARSNSAIAPRTCNCSLPAGVVASIPSARETNATPSAWSSSKNMIRCPPCDRALRVQALEIPDQQEPKVTTRRQPGPAILRIEPLAESFDEPVEVMVVEDLVQSRVERMRGAPREVVRRQPHRRLLSVSPAFAHRHRR